MPSSSYIYSIENVYFSCECLLILAVRGGAYVTLCQLIVLYKNTGIYKVMADVIRTHLCLLSHIGL